MFDKDYTESEWIAIAGISNLLTEHGIQYLHVATSTMSEEGGQVNEPYRRRFKFFIRREGDATTCSARAYIDVTKRYGEKGWDITREKFVYAREGGGSVSIIWKDGGSVLSHSDKELN